MIFQNVNCYVTPGEAGGRTDTEDFRKGLFNIKLNL